MADEQKEPQSEPATAPSDSPAPAAAAAAEAAPAQDPAPTDTPASASDAPPAAEEPAPAPAPATTGTADGGAAAAVEATEAAAKDPPLQAAMEEFRATNQTAFVAGFTGECGKALVEELAKHKIFRKVFLIGRREVALEGEIYQDFAVEQKVVDYDNLEASVDVFKGPTVGYCCLGTTRGKAGKEGFKKVDHDYVMKVGELAKQNGCKQYHLVSSVGANPNSSMLYPKVKGQVEEETADLGFDKFTIYRPGLLMCPRKEFRFAEKVSQFLMKPVDYFSPGSVTNTTISVAQAMIARTVKPLEEQRALVAAKMIYQASKEITG